MIAVICAHNPGKRNLGMYSVDLAAQDFFSAHGQDCHLLKFTGHRRIGRLRYRIIKSLAALEPYDTIVFWGDFQQNPVWGLRDFALRYARESGTTPAEAFVRWQQLCLLKDHALRPSQRLFSVGTCFLGARAALGDRTAVSEYSTQLGRFQAILPRDPGSLAELRACGRTNVLQGFDCATLLDHDPAPAVKDPCFGFAFGRTLTPQEAKAVARRIEELTGHRAVAIRWLLGKHALKFCGYRYAMALEVIRRVRCVVTDVYHLAINTLNLGRELVCVGLGNEEFLSTCDDYKKALLFQMTGLEDRYVEVPAGTEDRVGYIAARVAALLAESPGAGVGNFSRLRNDFRSQLQRLLFNEAGPLPAQS